MPAWLEDRIRFLRGCDVYDATASSKRSGIRLKLDANENWLIPVYKLQRLIDEASKRIDLRRYPDNICNELSVAAAQTLSVSKDSVVPTQGADQGIDLLCESFLRDGDRSVIVSPTYSFYRLRAQLTGARVVQVELNQDFSLPVERVLRTAGDGGLIFVCSPNNPTGNQFSRDDILTLCREFEGLVVVDEAYVDFASHTLVGETQRIRNLVVLRTFSKAYGLADARLGLLIADPEWAQTFKNAVQYPYPISALAGFLALQLLKKSSTVRKGLESLKRERKWLRNALRKIKGIQCFDSEANFLLVNLPKNSKAVHENLIRDGISTRHIGRVVSYPNCIRITVGTREMNLELIQALAGVLNDRGKL